MRAALIQLNAGDDPQANLPVTQGLIAEAAGAGATLVVTPECTNMVSPDRDLQRELLRPEAEDATLAALRAQAADAGIWVLAGSLMLKSDDPAEQRFINRSLLIGPDGKVAARYDKIHMFDADPAPGESYRESKAVLPGSRAQLVEGPARLGMTVCYDLRFPVLYRRLAQAGAQVLCVPAAWMATTGEHWQVLLRARAIETGCFVLAPAQCGTHPITRGDPSKKPRQSHGHSLAVAPWGMVLGDGGDSVGVTLVDINTEATGEARRRVGSVEKDQAFEGP